MSQKELSFSQWIGIFVQLIDLGWSTEEIISFTTEKYGNFADKAKPCLNFDANDGIE